MQTIVHDPARAQHTDEETIALHRILQVIAYARTIGAIPHDIDEAGADNVTFAAAIEALARLGIAQHVNHTRPRTRNGTAAENSALAAAVLEAIDGSPLPAAEWAPTFAVLGDHLHRLLAISSSSATRYRTGERGTPDEIAARLHFITQVVADLAGSYNDFGIRRWFDRPRQALDGQAPSKLLASGWRPEDPSAQRVRHLAHRLLG